MTSVVTVLNDDWETPVDHKFWSVAVTAVYEDMLAPPVPAAVAVLISRSASAICGEASAHFTLSTIPVEELLFTRTSMPDAPAASW